MGFDIDDDVTGERGGARPMSVEDERVVRDDIPVPNSLAELAAQPRPAPPPLPASKPRREPAGSFIRTRVSKKEKQADKRNHFVHSIAAAAAARQQQQQQQPQPSMLTDDDNNDAPPPPRGTDTLVDDFLSAVTELSASSNTAAVAPAHASSKARTIAQRARVELAEQAQFKAVLQHDAFKSDPLGALQEHLANRIKLEREQRARNAASLDALAAHDAQASRRLQRAVKHNRRNK